MSLFLRGLQYLKNASCQDLLEYHKIQFALTFFSDNQQTYNLKYYPVENFSELSLG